MDIGLFSKIKYMTRKKRFNWIHTIGPGLIVGALVFGPSKLTITSKIGANFGYDLLWIILIAIFFHGSIYYHCGTYRSGY